MQTKHKLNHSLFIFGLMILFFIEAFPLVQAQTAAPGDLDTTFGSGGKIVTSLTQGGDEPTRVRIQPDGKIVTVGYNLNFDFFPVVTFLVRHNVNGTVDNSFGTNGLVVVRWRAEKSWGDFRLKSEFQQFRRMLKERNLFRFYSFLFNFYDIILTDISDFIP